MKFLSVIILAILISSLISSCASRPQLYPNETYKKKGKTLAEQDIELCMKDADTFLESSKGKAMVKSAGAGALIGGAMGTVAGLFTGDIMRGAAQGAAMGGAGGAVGGALSPDQVKHNFVNQCLAEKCYNVLGWD
jgi:uncharacterized membrane protein